MDSTKNEVTIESEDIQCGHIYLHEPSMMLKFFCLYCEKIYDDINVYCKHLSFHMSSGTTLMNGLDESLNCHEELYENGIKDEEIVNVNNSNEVHYQNAISEGNIGVFEEEDSRDFGENNCSNDIYGYTEEDLDADEEESRQFLFEQNQADYIDGDGNDDVEFITSDNIEYDGDSNSKSTSVDSNGSELTSAGAEEATDFENLIGNAKILKKPPSSETDTNICDIPVKTFKIITLKNQIEELYSMVKNGRNDSAPGNISQKNLISSIKRGIERTTQIIGETVITSLPVEIDVKTLEKGTSDFKCHACNKVFRNQHSLSLHGRAHYMESQGDVKVAHKCSHCNKLFNKLKELQFHIQKDHYPDGFKCKLCHKVLRSIGMLELHMKKMHLKHDKFRCRLCGRNDFETQEAFEEHSVMHGDEEIFKCYICGRQYSLEGNLRQHVIRHSEKKPQRCVVCAKVTFRMTQHMKIHSPRPTKLLQCSICNQTFAFSSALSRHTKVMHKLPRSERIRNLHRNSNAAAKRPKKKIVENDSNNQSKSPTQQLLDAMIAANDDQIEEFEVNEPKKVIVEMIENVMTRKAVVDDYGYENMDCTVARYETIAAVQSISENS